MRPPARHFGALAQPLDDILGATSRVRVLRALDRSSVPLAAVTLARETGLVYNGVVKAVAVLKQSGLITEAPVGGTTVYAISPDHPFSAALGQLFGAERDRRRAVQTAVEEWASEQPATLRAVWLFGSVARREDTFQSDIDLALVAVERGRAQHYAEALREALAPVAERQHVHPNVLPYDGDEVVALPGADPVMWDNLTRDAVSLHGPDPNTLRTNLEQQARRRHG